jgi:tetratricopeptide (TPR) repeat protein
MSELKATAEAARSEALALLEKGEFSPALAAYDRALEAANATNDPAFADWMFVCRAAAAAELGPADKELIELKCVLLRTLDPGTSFRAAYTAARIYEIRRNYARAASYNARARSLVTRLSDPLLAGAAENQAGSILSADSRFAEAAASYRRCLDLADLSNATAGQTPALFSPAWRAICQDNLGYSLIALDQVSEGLALVHESFETLEALGARAYSIVPLVDLCFGYLKSDRYAEARYFGEAALERLAEPEAAGETASSEKNILYLLGETCHLAGDDGAARTYFDRLASLYPEFRNLRAYLEVFDFRNVINLRS